MCESVCYVLWIECWTRCVVKILFMYMFSASFNSFKSDEHAAFLNKTFIFTSNVNNTLKWAFEE